MGEVDSLEIEEIYGSESGRDWESREIGSNQVHKTDKGSTQLIGNYICWIGEKAYLST